MNYFPPKNFEEHFGCVRHTFKGDWRLGQYRKWYMAIYPEDNKYGASVWMHYALSKMAYDDKKISFSKDGFENEEEAAQWCLSKINSRYKSKLIERFYCIDCPNDQMFQDEKEITKE